MSHEEQLARQLCHILDRGTLELDDAITERLRAARERALDRQRLAITAPAILGAGGTAVLASPPFEWHPLRSLLAILALLLGVCLSYYWNGFTQAGENIEIDSALLADELPPNAYLDRGFQAWLENHSASGQ